MSTIPEPFKRPPLPLYSIKPSKGWASLRLKELWEYRELMYFLALRDIQVRYKQTILGIAWAILQPLFSMVVFSFFFGKLAQIPSDGIPYPLFSFAALLPWTFFANGINQSTTSLVANANLIKKVYFPRLIVPISAILSGGLDFFFSFIVLLGIMLAYKMVPDQKIIFLPFLLLLALITSLGVGFWLTALNVKYRDVRYAVPFLLQAWLFASPIVYPSRLLEEPWRTLYGFNPMVGVIDGFRWALLPISDSPSNIIITSTISALILLVSGTIYFQQVEKDFADVA